MNKKRVTPRFTNKQSSKPMLHTHLITLINRATDDEQSFEVATASDRFCDVVRAVAHEKLIRGLRGYELFEAIAL